MTGGAATLMLCVVAGSAVTVGSTRTYALAKGHGLDGPTALLVAISATLLCFIPYLNFFTFSAAGFFAVFFYRRRTGYFLSMEGGVWMGWITGLLMFAIMACVVTGSWLIFRAMGGVAAFPAEFKAAVDPKALETVTKMFENGADVAKMLLAMFVYTTLLSMIGGFLGAYMVGRE